jgi:hypothetical protein
LTAPGVYRREAKSDAFAGASVDTGSGLMENARVRAKIEKLAAQRDC